MRQIGYEALEKRQEAGQVRGLAYVHLTQGLSQGAVDWKDCMDPLNAEDQLPDSLRKSAVTDGGGIDKRIQRLLARIRTDLDAFSEIESAAPMASGYRAMDTQLTDHLFKTVLPQGHGQPMNVVLLRRRAGDRR